LRSVERLAPLAPQFVSIVNRGGEVTDSIPDPEGRQVPVIPEAIERAAAELKPQYREVSLGPSEAARVITWPSHDEDGEMFFVVIGQSPKSCKTRSVTCYYSRSRTRLYYCWPAWRFVARSRASTGRPRSRGSASGAATSWSESSRNRDEIEAGGPLWMISKGQAFEQRRFTRRPHERAPARGVARRHQWRLPRPFDKVQTSLNSSRRDQSGLPGLLRIWHACAVGCRRQGRELAAVRLDRLAAGSRILPIAESAGVACERGTQLRSSKETETLKQLLVNLLENAIGHTPVGGRCSSSLLPKTIGADRSNGHRP
jgi:hypothetical protein